jgi:DNA polymerase elongation subunit (family B)/predicted RNA-binding Zn-ribbon protein involved in translation (DUF1610 family)
MTKHTPKILLLDIETAFKIASVWGNRDEYVGPEKIIQDTHVLCWCAKWLDSKEMLVDALHYHKSTYKKDPSNDKQILKSVWKLLDQADYVIAHNGGRFDGPVLNARFIQHGLPPPSPYTMIDTLNVARRAFKFTSNRLDDLGKILKVGKKMETGGLQLWKDIVLKQDKKAFNKMVAYCEQDVLLLEKVYNALRAWDKKHPSTVILSADDVPQCNACGSDDIIRNGSYATNTQVYQKYKCRECGHAMRSRKASELKKDKLNLLRSI